MSQGTAGTKRKALIGQWHFKIRLPIGRGETRAHDVTFFEFRLSHIESDQPRSFLLIKKSIKENFTYFALEADENGSEMKWCDLCLGNSSASLVISSDQIEGCTYLCQ